MSGIPRYCPYDVTPLAALLDVPEIRVATTFGRVRCLRAGPAASGRGTVFLHGVHDDMDTWGPLVRAATENGVDLGRLLFIDLPGFGASENHRDRLDLAAVGDAVLNIASDLGFSSVRLVGHSMGTLVAADLAVRHHTRVESLHLAAGPYYSIVETVNGHWAGGLAGGVATAAFGMQYLLALTGHTGVAAAGWAARNGLLRPLLRPFVAHPGALRQSVVDHLVSGMRPGTFRQAARNGRNYRRGMSWAAVQCPVWAAYGQADRLVPAVDARRLTADLPAAHVSTVQAAAHLLHIEQPGPTLRALGLR